jgi:WD40 repeat protein
MILGQRRGSADEGRILSWSGDGTLRLWDAATGAQIGPPMKHDDSVSGALFSWTIAASCRGPPTDAAAMGRGDRGANRPGDGA